MMPLTADWVDSLTTFTQRNAGRPTRLEIADPDIGVQWEEVEFPLRGISYDPHDDRVEIMFGAVGDALLHLTHSITQPTSVDVLRGEDGRDLTLRIAHGRSSQTLLRLV